MCTNYFLNLVAGHVFKTKTSTALPTKFYLGLGNADPTVAGTAKSELSGGGYKRIEITGLSEPTNGACKNTKALSFPESTGNQGRATYYYIFDSLSGGNLLMYGPLTDARTIEGKTVVTIKEQELVLSVVNVT